MNLGIDIGGVIISRVNDGTDTSFFGDRYLETTAVPNAFESIKILKDYFDNVALVSKCGLNVQRKTLEWLDYHRFYEQTGINKKHVFFCKERKEKVGICEKLGINVFVDDRLEILGYMRDIVKDGLYCFNPEQKEVNRSIQLFGEDLLSKVIKVSDWEEIVQCYQ